MINFDSVKSYMSRYFQDAVPHIESSEYVVGTVLHTADSRKWSNATITHIDLSKKHGPYRVLTDFGNEININLSELQGMYLPPKIRRVRVSDNPLPNYHDVSVVERNYLHYTEIAKRINKMWIQYMSLQGYEVPDDAKGWEAIHPAEKHTWNIVCTLAESAFPDVDISEVLEYVESE